MLRRPLSRSAGFTLVELLVVIAIIGTLVGLLLPAIQAARESARRAECQNNLHNIGLALHNYASSKNSFPPGDVRENNPSKTLYSWVTLIMPYLEEAAAYESTDWTIRLEDRAAEGDTAHHIFLDTFACPSELNQPVEIGIVNSFYGARGNYVGNAGTGWYWALDKNPHEQIEAWETSGGTNAPRDILEARGEPDGIHMTSLGLFVLSDPNPIQGRRFGEITDGTSNTAAVSELRMVPGQDTRGAMHFGPAALYMHDHPPNVGARNEFTNRAIVDSTRWCDRLGPAKEIAPCVEADGEWRGLWQHLARSYHPGGINLAMADGSTQYINNDIEVAIWHALATADGQELVGDF